MSTTPGDRAADYFFKEHNVIAELKCLVADQRSETARKLAQIGEQRRANALPAGYMAEDAVVLHFVGDDGEPFSLLFDEEFQRAVSKVLLDPLYNIVRDANRQIRATKERLGLSSALGVVLIFNESNRLHALSPQHFARLVGEVIQKPEGQGRRFPHIHGMVYFSFRSVTTRDQETGKDMSFWMPAQVKGDSAEAMRKFQEDLKVGWCQYIAQRSGVPVVSHRRETGWEECTEARRPDAPPAATGLANN